MGLIYIWVYATMKGKVFKQFSLGQKYRNQEMGYHFPRKLINRLKIFV